MKKRINVAVIGAGAMAEAIISGLLKNEFTSADLIHAADPSEERRSYLKNQYNIRVSPDNSSILEHAEVILLSVKPQILQNVFDELKNNIPSEAFILSIVAGATIRTIQNGFNHDKVIRTMPNTPAQIGAGMTVWTAAKEIDPSQIDLARSILESLGSEIYVDDEKYLNHATAVSGSGPAYIYLFLEALIDAGVHIGMNRPMAEELAAQTMLGSIEYYLEKKIHPAQLRNQVTSPAGTTAAALYQFEKNGLRPAVIDAVTAAYLKSLELGKEKSDTNNTK